MIVRLHVGRRKRVLIKLSKDERWIAGRIFLVLLLGPLALLLWPMLLRDDEPWRVAVIGLCALVITALLIRQVSTAYRGHRSGVTLLAFAYGVGGFALVHVFYGSWVLATGLTPTKFNQVPIPRSYSANYFLIAALVAAVALAALIVELYRRKRNLTARC